MMKISNCNQLLAISTLLSGIIIFATLWHQYQKVETLSRNYFESRLLVQTVDHLFTLSQTWLTTQDLLFADRQTYLANGIYEQSSQLLQLLASVESKVQDKESIEVIGQLMSAIQKNDAIVNSFTRLSLADIPLWQKNVAASDSVTTSYVANLELIYAQVSAQSTHLSEQLQRQSTHLHILTWILITVYLLIILAVVTWVSKYIVKPIEKITALAQQPQSDKQTLQFRQDHAPREIIDLSAAIQQFIQHITIEKQKAEQERLNAVGVNEKISTIMDTIPCALLLLDDKGIIIECNGETESLFDREKKQIVAKPVADFLPVLATLAGQFDVEAVIANMEESLLAPSFDKPYVEYSGRKIVLKTGLNYLITISDINERKHSQKALSALNEQLVNAEKLASIGQLSAGIAHEINNPIGFIGSNLEMLKKYFTPIVSYIKLANIHNQAAAVDDLYQEQDLAFIIDDIAPLITSSLDGAARVSKIIKDLGNYAHVDNKEPELVDIDELIEQSLTLVANELKYKVDINKSLNAKVQVLGFPQRLLQVFINMLVNAAHAIEHKGSVFIQSSVCAGEVKLSFQDDGSGIAQQHLKHIFDPFFTTKPVGKGTGLGLHIVRSIIDDHQGRINASSIVDQGTTFDIYLPIHTDSESSHKP